ncbi:PRC-barrel domain-containing protein [Heliophilum fasciatum]|uniref:Uncharacterized protein YrrD n=1 Tax=Heliophilum fasciatum TaxID=35700 RepID=A0A4R2RY07_9FIRM|nr:PRC-barrel domain-containing protein [Heliophilum fasciatum]MCW2277021.1 uncharacterized protein YrrD [Heliophilum fasciatum]TCP68453.1 uncharacterized protein YrrD [Heliophilum fasciatum]
MLASKELLQRPIITLEEGQHIGTVHGLIVDPKTLEVLALQVEQRGLFREQKVIPYGKIHSIGDAAIIIDRSSHVQRSTNLPHLFQLMRERSALIGNRVLTTGGQKLGIIEDYYFEPQSGRILFFDIRGSWKQGWLNGSVRMPARCIRTISSEMVLVYENTHEYLEPISSRFSQTIQKIHETSEKTWDRTVTLQRQWGDQFSRTIEKFRNPASSSNHAGDDFPPPPWITPEAAAAPTLTGDFPVNPPMAPTTTTIPSPVAPVAPLESPAPDDPPIAPVLPLSPPPADTPPAVEPPALAAPPAPTEPK